MFWKKKTKEEVSVDTFTESSPDFSYDANEWTTLPSGAKVQLKAASPEEIASYSSTAAVSYADYLAESLEKSILYSDYIAEEIDKSLDFSDYLSASTVSTPSGWLRSSVTIGGQPFQGPKDSTEEILQPHDILEHLMLCVQDIDPQNLKMPLDELIGELMILNAKYKKLNINGCII